MSGQEEENVSGARGSGADGVGMVIERVNGAVKGTFEEAESRQSQIERCFG